MKIVANLCFNGEMTYDIQYFMTENYVSTI